MYMYIGQELHIHAHKFNIFLCKQYSIYVMDKIDVHDGMLSAHTYMIWLVELRFKFKGGGGEPYYLESGDQTAQVSSPQTKCRSYTIILM